MTGFEDLVSVIVPVHNCEDYLERCLDSLAAQVLSNIEFILVNNGSTDGSEEILRRYIKGDSRFHLISQENLGIHGSRNSGLLAARGTYIGFVDADDFVAPDMFQKLLDRASETGSDIVICDYAMTFPKHEERCVLGLLDEVVDAAELDQTLFYLRYFGKNPVVWNKLYRRSLFTDHSIQFEVGHGEDLLLHLRLLPYVRRLCTVHNTLYHYVQRRTSAAHSLTEVSCKDITLLERYLEGTCETQGSSRLVYFAFSNIFTGFMFSTHCIGKGLNYFYEQIQAFRHWEQFDNFCRTISTTEDLQMLYQEAVISIRFYWFQKFLFGICAHRHDHMAAFFLWISSKVIVLKKRRFLFGQFE